jgi:hypothetical protein
MTPEFYVTVSVNPKLPKEIPVGLIDQLEDRDDQENDSQVPHHEGTGQAPAETKEEGQGQVKSNAAPLQGTKKHRVGHRQEYEQEAGNCHVGAGNRAMK